MMARAAGARRLASLVMALCIFLSVPCEAMAAVPGFKAKKTNKNILALMKRYDKDAYHILKMQRRGGSNPRVWMKGGKRIVDKIDTCVHEEFHGYSFRYATVLDNSLYICYYAGKGKSWHVELTKVFRSANVMKKLPKSLRTYRYKTYVSRGAKAAANTQGVYGMLNEFSAYYWGMHSMYSLYPYLSKRAKKADDWMPFILSYIDNREAYSEFYFWTLTYLRYAKKHKPKVYKRIMENRDYLKVLHTTEKRFRKLIKRYDRRIERLSRRYNRRSFKNSTHGRQFYFGRYRYPVRDGYRKLRKQIASKKFRAVKRDIARNK